MKASSNLRVDWMIGVFPIILADPFEVVRKLLLPLHPSIEILRYLVVRLLQPLSIALPYCKQLIPNLKLCLLHVRLDL